VTFTFTLGQNHQMKATSGIKVLVSVSIDNLLVTHTVVSAGWEMTVNAFPPGPVKKVHPCTGT
jgi:hypothetical protein